MTSSFKFLLGLVLSIVALGSSSFGFELNSTNITSAPFNCNTSDTSCYLSNLGITSIASGTFVGFDSLTYLNLADNQINSIENGDFVGLDSLINLFLHRNQISSIESGDFIGLDSLNTLNLRNNQISSIEGGAFAGLTFLDGLALDSNYISSIESGTFAGLSALTYLNLADNQINSIENGDFVGLSALTSLGLDYNQISSIESDDFVGLDSLIGLYLNGNCLDIDNILFVNYLNTLPGVVYEPQSVCVGVRYSPTTTTTGVVTASLYFTGPASMVSFLSGENPNIGLYDYIFSNNGSYFFDYSSLIDSNNYLSSNTTDSQGMPRSHTIFSQVTWIDFIVPDDITPPIGTITYDITGPHNGVIMATLTLNETGTVTNNGGSFNYNFTGNGNFSFNYTDTAGNTGTATATVTWIDKIAPVPTITYSNTGLTNQSVVATLTLNETGILANNGGSFNYNFTGNGNFSFNYTDLAGNIGTATATVTWIDKIAPVIILNGGSSLSGFVGDTYNDAGATWSDVIDGTGTLIGSGTVNISLTGTYIIFYTITDTAGNISNATKTITIFARPTIPTPKPTSGGGGSVGGGSFPTKDNCPNGDYTSSEYDNQCGTKTTTNTGTTIKSGSGIIDKISTGIVQEKVYEWALSKGITTINTILQARLDNTITRAELAKMLSVYAIDILGKEPNISDACIFADRDQANKNLLPYITQVCQLKIMGLESDGKTPLQNFNPNAYVTRAQFGTVLSRILYGNKYDNNDGNKWREGHLKKLQQNNIISVTIPTLEERRGWVMTMLYRTTQE